VPPRKKAPAGPPPLTDDDVAMLKARVAAGDKPRVIVRTASAAVPAGTRGNVIRVGNPSDGEFIVVRLGRDEVPFAPSELGLTTRSKAAAPPVAPPTPTPKRTIAKPAKAAPARATPKTATATPRRTSGARTAKRSQRAAPPLTVTLRFANDAWTVEAQRGARRIAKASPLRPGAVKAFADLVDEPQVREAMSETVATSRAVVEQRAEKLRAELHAAEATLKEYEARRR
jgi:hypothetical protein